MKEIGIPDGLEIAFYYSLSPEQYNKIIDDGNREMLSPIRVASQFYEQDERKRAMFGVPYMVELPKSEQLGSLRIKEGTWGNDLFFLVDEPINYDEFERNSIYKSYRPKYFVGGVQYYGLMMGRAYYEEHKEEIKKIHIESEENRVVEDDEERY